MSPRRHVLISTFALTLLSSSVSFSQPVVPPGERALRDAFVQFQAALGRRDVAGMTELLTTDAVWIFPQSNSKDSREAVVSYVAMFLNSFDLNLEIIRLRMYENDTRATLVLRGRHLGLPKKDGMYAAVWNREPLIARWRLDGGKWRMHFITDNPTEASALAKAEGLQ